MSAILEEQYFEWLYSHIADPDQIKPNKTYWNLAKQLHKKEFVYIIANDDNRWLDGRELRHEFQAEEKIKHIPSLWLGLACSMLEMLIALAKRLEFQTDEAAEHWFWQLLGHLGLAGFSDAKYNETISQKIDEALDRVIWRTYEYSGQGGLFPLQRAETDQTELEIWYQMHSYLLEGL